MVIAIECLPSAVCDAKEEKALGEASEFYLTHLK
jgi:hypothetical protein